MGIGENSEAVETLRSPASLSGETGIARTQDDGRPLGGMEINQGYVGKGWWSIQIGRHKKDKKKINENGGKR